MQLSAESVPPAQSKNFATKYVANIVPKLSSPGATGIPASATLACGATNGGAAGIVALGARLGGAFGSGTLFSENRDLATGTSARETGEDEVAGDITVGLE